MTACGLSNECGRDAAVMGLCKMHYSRWQQRGYPDGWPVRASRRRPAKSPEEAFATRTEWRDECLVWTGFLNPSGYGQMSIRGKLVRVHRYAWERENGPIPDGMLIDHICHNRACVNAAHLRPATQGQNQANRRRAASHNRTTGLLNITLYRGKYIVRVHKDGRTHSRTRHTLEDALLARSELRKELFGEYDGELESVVE